MSSPGEYLLDNNKPAIAAVRKFESGATRSSDTGKPDYEGFLHPAFIARFGQYMNKHRVQADGTLRDSDNWQKGIPKASAMKSGWRHFHGWWSEHRGLPSTEGLEDEIMALVFNAQSYWLELYKEKK